jgi:hypothetical protein
MAASNLVRWGGLAAMGAGVLFISNSFLGVAVGNADEPGPLDILAILGYVLQMVGLVGFHALQARHYGRIGRAGLYTTIGAILIFEFLLLASLLGNTEGPGWLLTVGLLGTLVGLVLYGAATLQARVLPRWCGVLFIILVPGAILFGSILPGDYSIIWSGLVWVALGYALWAQSSGAAGEQPSRVR